MFVYFDKSIQVAIILSLATLYTTQFILEHKI